MPNAAWYWSCDSRSHASSRPASNACFKSLVDEGCGERAREPDPEHDRETPNLVFQGHSLANQLLAGDDQRAERMSLQRLHMYGLEETSASQMRQTSRVVAIGLVVASDLSAWSACRLSTQTTGRPSWFNS
jgi:hypothetical protein